MKIVLRRIALRDTYTIGRLYIDGKYFCDTLEDRVLDTNKNGKFDEGEKIKHYTAIPYGKYEVIVNRSPRFKRELPRLLNVPYFEGILIHGGSNANHTSGCILVGENKVKGMLVNSKPYIDKLTQLIKLKQAQKIKVNILIE